MLKGLGLTGWSFNIADEAKYAAALEMLRESLHPGVRETLFAADNVITWNRNFSFLRDRFFVEMLSNDNTDLIEKSTVWRLYVVLHFAELAQKLEGDFAEFGCYIGHTAAKVLQKIDFAKLNKNYYLYDL